MAADRRYTGDRGLRRSFTLSGVWPFALTAAGRFQQPDLGLDVPLNLRGALARDHLSIDEGALSLYQGTASLRGEARWSPRESWKFAGAMRGFDPAAIRAALPGRLNFDFDVAGDAFGSRATIDARFRNLDGQLRGAARARGRAASCCRAIAGSSTASVCRPAACASRRMAA